MDRTDIHLDRALLLYQQRRYPDAERELRSSLALNPQPARPHALLAMCLAQQEKFADASVEADHAVGAEPDEPFAHYVRGLVLYMRNRYEVAAAPAAQAVGLDPWNAEYRWLVGAIHFEQNQWPAALEAAAAGLAIDPDHSNCINLRAMALVKLGRKAEAGAAIDQALANDPENAATHANRGWTLLHQGDHKRALIHFKESLRLNPESQWARAGIIEAVKAKNPIYRVVLRYFLWMSNLTPRARWAIVLGGYFGVRVLESVREEYPGVSPFVQPIIIAYVIFALMTWLAEPLSNLLLRFSRFGRLALSRRQIWSSNVLGILFLAAGVAAVIGYRGGGEAYYVAAITMAVLTIPAASCFRMPAGWPTGVMAAGTVALAIVGACRIALWFQMEAAQTVQQVAALLATESTLGDVFTYGLLGALLASNQLRSVRLKK